MHIVYTLENIIGGLATIVSKTNVQDVHSMAGYRVGQETQQEQDITKHQRFGSFRINTLLINLLSTIY